MAWFPRSFRARLSVVAGIALVVRIAVVLTDWRRTQEPGVTDEGGYQIGAKLLAQGHGLINPFIWMFEHRSEPTAGHPPLYTMVLSVPSVLGFDSPLSLRIFNLLIGVVLVVAVGLLARALAGDRAALLAALLASLYPTLWISDTAIMPETLYSLLVLLAIGVGYRLWRTPSFGLALSLGALLSLAALTRSEGLMLFAFVGLPFVAFAQGVDRARKVRMFAAVLAVGAVLIGAWVGRNLATFDKPTFMASGSGHLLANSNCDSTYHGENLGYWSTECGLKKWPKGDESVIDVAARKVGVDYMRENAGRVPTVALARVGRVWGIYRPLQGVDLDAFWERRGLWPSRLALGSFYLLVVGSIFGLVQLRRRKILISPVVGLIVAMTLTIAFSTGITRYRAPIDAMLPVLAAVGIDAWWVRRRAAGAAVEGENRSDERASMTP